MSNRPALIALCAVVAAVLLAAFFTFLNPAPPALAQTPTVYHVWDKKALCGNLLGTSGEVVDTSGYIGSITTGQWYTYTEQKPGADGQNNEIDKWFTVCGFGAPPAYPRFAYNLSSYGGGGYKVATTYDVNWTHGVNLADQDSGGTVIGGGTAGCRSLSGGISNTVVLTPASSTRWGYQVQSRASVDERFCSSTTLTWVSIGFRFGEEAEPEPEPTLTCENGLGIEVLQAGPLAMPANSAWEGNLVTGTLPWERAWVTFWFTSSSIPGRLSAEFNGATMHLIGWDRYDATTKRVSVPNRDRVYHRDPYDGHLTYEKFGFVTVPPVNLRFATTKDLVLTSVCLKEASRPLTPSLLCPDGLEVLTEPLMAGDYAGRVFEDVVAVTATHIAVRYVLDNPYYPAERLGGGIMTAPEINDRAFLVNGTWRGRATVTYTLPTTGAIYLPSENVKIGFRNEGPQVQVLSICIIDALEAMPQLRESECHLINPDFVQGLAGWSQAGMNGWDSAGNGTALLNNGSALWQVPVQDTGTVWKMAVRARAYDMGAPGSLRFGTSTENLVAGGPQLYTATLPAEWAVYSADVFVEERSTRLTGGVVQIQGYNVQADYVCLTTPDDAMPVPECERPVWNPAGSGDPLYIYLFKYLADWIMYGICLVIRAISIAYNGLIRLLDNILLRIPNFDPNDGILGLADWLNAIVFRMLDWIGASFAEFFTWLGGVFAGFGEFIRDIVVGFIVFLGDILGFNPFALLADMNGLWNDTLWFMDEIQAEIGLEFADLLRIIQNMGNVMIVLMGGVREGVTGETVAYLGEDFDGIGAYIWEGVSFVNDALQGTPLPSLGLVAMGAMAIGLTQWTLKKFTETFESLR